MKITIDSLEVKEGHLSAILNLRGTIENKDRYHDNISDSSIMGDIRQIVASELASRLLLERGPEIMNSITNNQIINAVIMKVSGALAGEQRVR